MNKYNNVNFFEDDQGNIERLEIQKFAITNDKPEILSSLNVVIGGEYVVKPDNPQKLKHRDRIVTVQGFVADDIGNPESILVKFKDNNAAGKVDIYDLAAIEA